MRNKSGVFTGIGRAFGLWSLVVGQKGKNRCWQLALGEWLKSTLAPVYLRVTTSGQRPIPKSQWLLCAVFLFGALSLASAAPQDIVPHSEGRSLVVEGTEEATGAARQLFDLLNRERVKAGLPPLAWDDRLVVAALGHAQLMAQQNRLAHQFPDEPPLRLRLAAVPLNHSGENVAVSPTVVEAHEGLMASPPHRANILNTQFNAVGIGTVRTSMGLWLVQDFAERISEVSGQLAADQIANVFAQARAGAGLKPLKLSDPEKLSSLSCDMARQGRADASPALRLPDARYGVAYTSLDPGQLPADLLRLRAVRDVKRYAVGACFGRTTTYPSGTYWVLVVFFAQ